MQHQNHHKIIIIIIWMTNSKIYLLVSYVTLSLLYSTVNLWRERFIMLPQTWSGGKVTCIVLMIFCLMNYTTLVDTKVTHRRMIQHQKSNFFLFQSLQLKVEGLEERDHVSIKTKSYLIEMLTSGNQYSNEKVTVWKYY